MIRIPAPLIRPLKVSFPLATTVAEVPPKWNRVLIVPLRSPMEIVETPEASNADEPVSVKAPFVGNEAVVPMIRVIGSDPFDKVVKPEYVLVPLRVIVPLDRLEVLVKMTGAVPVILPLRVEETPLASIVSVPVMRLIGFDIVKPLLNFSVDVPVNVTVPDPSEVEPIERVPDWRWVCHVCPLLLPLRVIAPKTGVVVLSITRIPEPVIGAEIVEVVPLESNVAVDTPIAIAGGL